MGRFPASFMWGTSTSAYQIEGAFDEDGKGPSIWDEFVRRRGTIVDGSTGDVACDHYHRWAQDVRLLAELGVDAYRFSVSWPRVIPDGRGPTNPAGLGFYDRLVDALLDVGVEPMVTLYHWDLPLTLEERGGWPSRDTAECFARYASVMAAALGDRVHRWVTINEPWVVAERGYVYGDKAPGRRNDGRAALAAAHHLLLGHGLATEAIVAERPGAQVGITLNLSPVVAASRHPLDVDAARRLDGDLNRWYLDPLYGRGYPDDVIADHRADRWLEADGLEAFVGPHDMETIATPTGFLGVNYYERTIARDPATPVPPEVVADDAARTAMGWEAYPEGLRVLLHRLWDDYGPSSIVVTENGASFPDGPGSDGRIHDERRSRFIDEHIDAVGAAVGEGVPVDGYFVWSLLDNFEWALGYTQRFGLVWVDFATLERIPKGSYFRYRDRIAAERRAR